MNPGDTSENDPRVGFRPTSQGKSPYQFSPEEMRVMRECNRESFYQRCIPLSTALGIATYFGINAGYVSASARFGAAPKVTIAVIFGYFIGKFSYQQKCAEKLMQLPNSEIGEMLRQRRRGNFKEGVEPGLGPSLSMAPFGGFGSAEQYSDIEPDRNPNHDIDTNRPHNDGLDDSLRPNVDTPSVYEEEMPPVQKHTTSYEELRKKNREEFAGKRLSSYKDVPTDSSSAVKTDPITIFDAPPPSSRKAGTNKYGDSMD